MDLLLADLKDTVDVLKTYHPRLCTSNAEKRLLFRKMNMLSIIKGHRSIHHSGESMSDYIFRHLKPQGAADLAESALLSDT